jgi:CheY-like chemotaxis protein
MANAHDGYAHQESPAVRGAGLLVLVVEDEPDAAESMRQILTLYGYRAEVARDGSSAVALARQIRPDVVLLDIGLPGGMDGLKVARKIRELPDGRPPLLIAVTGRNQEEDRRRSESAGVHLHIVKPADPEVLRCLLARFRALDG